MFVYVNMTDQRNLGNAELGNEGKNLEIDIKVSILIRYLPLLC